MKGMTITYEVGNSLYLNITNRCSNRCDFCIRQNGDGAYGSNSLWLEREPTLDEVKASIDGWDLPQYDEVVFCGYGEPTERLADLLEIAAYIKAKSPSTRIRVNTNGLADLIYNRSTAAEFVGKVDCVSISLNTDDPQEYLDVCRPKFGAAAYPALQKFAADAAAAGLDVVMTVVDEPVTSKEKQARCQAICDRLGVRLRIRPFEK